MKRRASVVCSLVPADHCPLVLLQIWLFGAVLLGTFVFGSGYFPLKVHLEGFSSAKDMPAPLGEKREEVCNN